VATKRSRVDRIGWALALLVGTVNPLMMPARAGEETLTITLDRARVVKLPAGAQTLVIGNPIIADVTLLRQTGTMVVTGKAFGDTNLVALDSGGRPVAETLIRVIASGNILIVQRGVERQSYSCNPLCQPTIRLGDDDKFFSAQAAQTQARNAQASSPK
jgi:Flp pilus assembly secretin CpaC